MDKCIKMNEVLMEANFVYQRAARMYAARYPEEENLPSRQSFRRMANRLRETGSVGYGKRQNVSRPVTGEANSIYILGMMAVNPQQSARRIAKESGLSREAVRRILRDGRMQPYRMKEVHEILPRDMPHRLEFATWAAHKPAALWKNVLFTNEATFMNCAEMNKQNCRYWASAENPNWMRQAPLQHQWKLNVWCGVVGDRVIGPHFFDDILTGNMYVDFLRNVLPTLLEDVPLGIRADMWYQQDGAPPHKTNAVVRHLNLTFHNKWIGIRGPIAWPARSSDLTPLDFFLWGRVKDLVYATAPTTPEDMRQRIVDACASITVEEIRNARISLADRFRWCINAKGGHFDHVR